MDGVFTNRRKSLWAVVLATVLVAGTGSYITPRLTQASQINLNTGTEPRSLSDIINFTQKSNLVESQLTPLTTPWEQALRTANRYFGTPRVYKESCTKYNCTGGSPAPRDVEIANITVGANPWGVSVNPSTNRVYVSNRGANSVSVIDGGTNTVLTGVAVGSFPSGVGVNPSTNLVYVTNQGGNSVSVINATSNTVLATIPVFGSGFDVAVNPTTNRVYVTAGNSVSVINATSNTVLATIPVGLSPLGVGVNPSTNRVYVSNFGSNTVSVIDGVSNTVLTTINVGFRPRGIGVNPSTNLVYVANQGGNSVSVINATINAVLTAIPVGTTPVLVGVNSLTKRVYVANHGSGSVSVIDGNTNIVLNNVTVGSGPVGVGVNPSTNRIYVSNYLAEATISVIGQREEMREACLLASANCLVVSSTGTLFPGTPQTTPVSLVAVSLRSNTTKTGTQMALTVVCDNNTTNPNQQCSAFYVDGNVWGPGQTDLSKSPFIIQNAEPYFYLQFHWWDFNNLRIVAWGTWWYGTAVNPNWYWGVYWWWRTYVNYYIGIWLPWWWWDWHWTYWRYWYLWNTIFPT